MPIGDCPWAIWGHYRICAISPECKAPRVMPPLAGGDHTALNLKINGAGKHRWTVPEDTLSLIRESGT